jgi:Haem-binding domain/Cytochrome P460
VRWVWRVGIAGIVVFAILQLVRPGIPAKAATAELQYPPEVAHVLDRACYSCHSDQRRLAWFDYIVPGYWLVRHDILQAREHLNFSTLGAKAAAAQKGSLYESVSFIQLGAMPLQDFLMLHPSARVTPEEMAMLKAYLAPWASPPPPAAPTAGPASHVAFASVGPEPDGFPFDSTFEGWKLLSITDRGDNNTFRFILGNDIAIRAAEHGDMNPWPDGTRFAKIAWSQELGTDGLVHPGAFIQVELMVKNARVYRKTDGWGWGRWRGLDLKPYGADAHFVNECTGCHYPVAKNDHVYTLPISPAGLPQMHAWRPLTMDVDPKTRTMATLFGTDTGTTRALVTWTQRDDPHWFGARIPDALQSLKFVDSSAYRGLTPASLP